MPLLPRLALNLFQYFIASSKVTKRVLSTVSEIEMPKWSPMQSKMTIGYSLGTKPIKAEQTAQSQEEVGHASSHSF